MRVVLDLQALFSPTTARRGIGFYAEQLGLALCRTPRGHEVHLLFNHAGGHAAVVAARQAFRDLVPHDNVHVLEPIRVQDTLPGDGAAAAAANEALREALLATLEPDVVLVTSLFELSQDCPTTIGRWTEPVPTAVVLYDLMPLEDPGTLLADPRVRARYERTLDDLRRASALLAISEHSRDRVMALLDPCPSTTAIYGAAIPLPSDGPGGPPSGLGGRSFVLCVGGDHPRKNMDGLIRAWGRTHRQLRHGRVLVLACELSDATIQRLEGVARAEGLRPHEVLITGFLHANDLAWLYDEAELFVFPSFSEGLGLPALEAMQRGCPVLVADATSLRELVEDPQARFDPADPDAIAECIERALTDRALLEKLQVLSVEQSRRFTWERTAELTWEQLERLAAGSAGSSASDRHAGRRRLAVVSPWPPVRSGVADYALMTTPALADRYDVTMVGEGPVVEGVDRMPRADFARRWHEFDRVLYHVGNSPYHTDDMVLLPHAPGVVLLHDSTLSGTLRFADEPLGHPGGVDGLLGEGSAQAQAGTGTDQRGLRAVLSGAVGVQVHSPHAAAEVARAGFSQAPVAIVPHPVIELEAAEAPDRLPGAPLVVGHFGFVHSFKLPDVVIEAAALAARRLERNVHVVFVGAVEPPHQAMLAALADRLGAAVRFTGFVPPEELAAWTASVDCAVQLRSVSHGESSGSVTRLLAAGKPTIVSDIGSFSDLPRDVVRHHPPGGSADALAAAMEECLTPSSGAALGARAAAYAREALSLDTWVEGTHAFLERAYAGHLAACGAPALRQATNDASERLLPALVRAVAVTDSRRPSASSVWASDISVLSVTPFLTGIQRVTLSLHRELARELARRGAALVASDVAPARVPVEPHASIRADPVLGGVQVDLGDCDWLLCLDLDFALAEVEDQLQQARARGTRVLVNVYDLLVVTNPEWFVPRAAESVFLPWLHTVVRVADVITVNSEATAEALKTWTAKNAPSCTARLRVHVLPLGVDPPARRSRSTRLGGSAHVVVVGTVEPRKGHDDVLDAFELLWAAGEDVRLTFIGRQGWMVEQLVERLVRHRELGRRLQWLSTADDDALEQVMDDADAAVVASRGEGYGLPVVEAAVRGLRLFVRDVPVLREVAADGATYFGGGGAELADVIAQWLHQRAAGEDAPAAGAVRLHTWNDVARMLVSIVDSA